MNVTRTQAKDPRDSGRQNERGLTLVEMAVASGVGAIVLLVVTALSVYAMRSFAAIGNYAILDAQSRQARDRMVRDIHQATEVKFCYSDATVKSIKFTTQTDTGPSSIKYLWYPEERVVVCERPGQPEQTYLNDCDQWDYRLYSAPQANAANGLAVTTNLTDCRVVEFSWLCSRTYLGRKWNSESTQNVRVMLRNQR